MTHPKHRIFVDREYRKWIGTRCCLACLRTPSDCHHLWPSGGNKKTTVNDYLGVPLCREHHIEYHQNGHRAFEEKHVLDFKDEVINLLSERLQQQRGKQ